MSASSLGKYSTVAYIAIMTLMPESRIGKTLMSRLRPMDAQKAGFSAKSFSQNEIVNPWGSRETQPLVRE